MQSIKLLPGQTVLDVFGNALEVKEFDSIVSVYDQSKEDRLEALYSQWGDEYVNWQLERGMSVETEHSDDREIQYSIALDHILEFINYYDALEKMEADLEAGIEF